MMRVEVEILVLCLVASCGTLVKSSACSDVVCQNGGACYVASNPSSTGTGFVCVCAQGYEGTYCELETPVEAEEGTTGSACSHVVCQNGGACYVASNPSSTGMGFVCVCAQGYEGTYCDLETEEGASTPSPTPVTGPCASKPCMNGATCINPTDPDATAPLCQCAVGYVGYICDRADTGHGDCDPNPCGSYGMCNPSPFSIRGYTCECQHGYTGEDCERSLTPDSNACNSSPCRNGAQCFNKYQSSGFICSCLAGYSGELCDVAGPCVSDPCSNGGTCMEDNIATLGYHCLCTAQHGGVNCTEEIPSNPCSPNPCQMNAPCYQLMETAFNDHIVPFYCSCPTGYIGTQCQIIDPCASGPCSNGATCSQVVSENDPNIYDYVCDCLSDFTGPTCSTLAPCFSNPCSNGGSCANVEVIDPVFGTEETGYICACVNGWEGENCQTFEQVQDACASMPCQNGGKCKSTGSFYTCTCSVGFVGDFCQYDDPCLPNPCLNDGQCFIGAEGNTFICLCSQSFTGSYCERYVTACSSNPCQNGGVCSFIPAINSYSCSCTGQYTGRNCEYVDPCFSSPCQNDGLCLQNTDSSAFLCSCQNDFHGVYCELGGPANDLCTRNPCEGDSTCVVDGPDLLGNYAAMCLCPTGFTGLTCAIELPPTILCQSGPCLNGGSCESSPTSFGGFICKCAADFSGARCQINEELGLPTGPPVSIDYQESTTDAVLACASNPCLNGGTCQNYYSTYSCLCPRYFVGPTCETDLRDCPYNDHIYQEGETRIEGCGLCTCENGEWTCTDNSCDCSVGVNVYLNNETWTEDCNTCGCQDGVAVCTDIDCSSVCLHEGHLYEIGSQRDDRCTSCLCQFGRWYCAQLENCVDGSCMYGNTAFDEGSIRPQYCNLCSCRESEWQCSSSSCEDYPVSIDITIEFEGDSSTLNENEDEFERYFDTEMNTLYYLLSGQLQNIEVSPDITGDRLTLSFSLVKNSTIDISVEAAADALEAKVLNGDFVLNFAGHIYLADASSFTSGLRVMENPTDSTIAVVDQGNSSIVFGAVGGAVGLIVVVISIVVIVYCVKSKQKTDGNTPLNLQNLFPNPESTPPVSPSHQIERSRTIPAHFRFKNNPFV